MYVYYIPVGYLLVFLALVTNSCHTAATPGILVALFPAAAPPPPQHTFYPCLDPLEKENFENLDLPPAERPEQNVVRTQKPKKKSRTSAEVYATSVYVLSVAAHHPAGSRAVVPTPPSPALPAARTPSPALATRRSITSLTHTRGASPAPQFDAQSAPPTIPRAPPKPSRERVLSHVGFESFPTTCSRSQQDPSRPAAHVSASLHGPPAQQSLSITARTTARRRHPTRTAERTGLATSDPATTQCVAAHHPRIHRARSRPGRHIILPAQLLLMSLHGAPVQRSLSITRAHNRQTPAMRRGRALAATPNVLESLPRPRGQYSLQLAPFFFYPSPPSCLAQTTS